MNVSIWDKVKKVWITRCNIKQLYQDKYVIELNFNKANMESFDTKTYELTFVHKGFKNGK